MLCLFEKFEKLFVKNYLLQKPLGVCMMHYTCVACNLTRDNSILYGDGSTKVFFSMVVETSTNKILGVEKDGSNDFSERIPTYNPSIQ
jgi:hypothetical protein